MVNSFAYVGHVGPSGDSPQLSTYFIDSRSADGVHPWRDSALVHWRVKAVGGQISLEMQRKLRPQNCSFRCHGMEPEQGMKVVWAMGGAWKALGEGDGEERVAEESMHFLHSSSATVVHLGKGEAHVENLPPVFAVRRVFCWRKREEDKEDEVEE